MALEVQYDGLQLSLAMRFLLDQLPCFQTNWGGINEANSSVRFPSLAGFSIVVKNGSAQLRYVSVTAFANELQQAGSGFL